MRGCGKVPKVTQVFVASPWMTQVSEAIVHRQKSRSPKAPAIQLVVCPD